ncbi:N-formylglutamate amidohydrolase [Desulfoluna butyratoxydans]|uniref:N-formylglutamate amidohydrolase n=1 Tax=Desulfoluna butyratoxydans TaxID=231438 RepID=A0A4U8YRS3_9BACT|nr:N-formylglutamate amidohydrolase [Desulfoluna butyratoxydans]VFQ46570.1 n-formylglutamate amidohydrolase [Desulfoluna butyratoxydans]
MKRLPIALSLPHGGLDVPAEVRHLCQLSPKEIQQDGDEGARDIAMPLRPFMASYTETHIARAFVDLNRKEKDISRDGVVKTHTCWDIPIYSEPLPPRLIKELIRRYHRPYHASLSELANTPAIALGLDLHTMAEHAPPIASDPGSRRPRICLGNNNHSAAPRPWVESMAEIAARHIDPDVTINTPFSGGWITQCHGREMPWIQLEISREPWIPHTEKGEAVLEMLQRFIEITRF